MWKLMLGGLAGALMSLAVCVGNAAASQAESFTYTVDHLQQSQFSVIYSTGVLAASGGYTQAHSGAIQTAIFANNAVNLYPAGTEPMDGVLQQWLMVGSAPITGTAVVPAGTTATITNDATGQTVKLTGGPFSVPTGAGVGARPPRRPVTIKCRGGARSCTARIPIAGGAANRRISIRLTDTNLLLRSVRVHPSRDKGAYLLSDGHYKLGGSVYAVTLNAVQSAPRGAYVQLTFRASSLA